MDKIVNIKNCNNIDNGQISLVFNKLNIKYGINGTGKSTISKAIMYQSTSPEKLDSLIPFKSTEENILKPEVDIPDEIKKVSIFNEEYINQFVYKEDELIANSFEIFIKGNEYIKSEQKIKNILGNVKKVFQESDELSNIVNDFGSLANSFKTTKSGISKSSTGYKALKDGNKLENIPDDLKHYEPF